MMTKDGQAKATLLTHIAYVYEHIKHTNTKNTQTHKHTNTQTHKQTQTHTHTVCAV